ncbi:MAG: hypothetical protein MUF42_05345 [Cytophagaceae bacterium]|jgi:hypothetical protein|nr:hypothetical protein [Cytophagaceae bacterium]
MAVIIKEMTIKVVVDKTNTTNTDINPELIKRDVLNQCKRYINERLRKQDRR